MIAEVRCSIRAYDYGYVWKAVWPNGGQALGTEASWVAAIDRLREALYEAEPVAGLEP